MLRRTMMAGGGAPAYTGWTPANASVAPYFWGKADAPGNTYASGQYSVLADLSGNGRHAPIAYNPVSQVAAGIGGRNVMNIGQSTQGFAVGSSTGVLNNKTGATSGAVYNIVDQVSIRGRTLFLVDTPTTNTARFLHMAAGYVAINKPAIYTRRLDADSSTVLNSPTAFTNDTISVACMDYVNNNSSLRQDGAEVAASTSHGSAGNTSATNSSRGLSIGTARPPSGSIYDGLGGYLGEAVFWDVPLSEAEQEKLEGYLAWTWNLLANLPGGHPYKSVQPSP